MEKGYKILKKELKSTYRKYISHYHHDPDFKPRCYRVIDMLCLIKYSTINRAGLDELYKLYDIVCTSLNEMKNIEFIYQKIISIEKTIILSLITGLDMIEDEGLEVYIKAENEIRGSHDKFRLTSLALFYFAAPMTVNGAYLQTYFNEIWLEKLQPIFNNMIGLDNEYLKQYSKLVLCEKENINGQDKITFSENPEIDPDKIFLLFDSIFMNSRNFKFIWKASKIYKTFSNYKSLKKFQKASLVQVTNTRIPYNLHANNIQNITNFEITSDGINIDTKCREDGMVLFGKHDLADVQLIESDFPICDICFAIFYKEGQYIMLDCAKYNYSSIKMEKSQEYAVEPGTIIDFTKGLMHIFNIDAETYEKKVLDVIKKPRQIDEIKSSNSEINENYFDPKRTKIHEENSEEFKEYTKKFLEFKFSYEYLSGPFAYQMEDSCKIKNAKNSNNKDTIIFGRGGATKEVDIYMNLNGYTSAQHISFRYDIEQGRMLAKDLDSRCGSYKLLKKKQEDSNKQWSKIYPLFIQSETILSICDYIFFFNREKINEDIINN